jgi:hypothetical protein
MPTSFTPEMIYKTRYGNSFEILRGYDNHPQPTAPSGASGATLYANTYWKAGTMLALNAAGYVVVAPSGAAQWFALQDVQDLSGNNGYRNLQNTVAARGEFITCQYGVGMAATAIHAGTGSRGDIGVWDGSTMRFIPAASYVAGHGKAVCVLEHVDGTDITRGLTTASATAGDKDTPSDTKAIIRFSIPLV